MTTVFTDGKIILADRRVSISSTARERDGHTKQTKGAHDETCKIQTLDHKKVWTNGRHTLHHVCVGAGSSATIGAFVRYMRSTRSIDASIRLLSEDLTFRKNTQMGCRIFFFERETNNILTLTLDSDNALACQTKITEPEKGVYYGLGSGSTLYRYLRSEKLLESGLSLVDVFQACAHLDSHSGPTYSAYNIETQTYIDRIVPKPGVMQQSAQRFLGAIKNPAEKQEIIHCR